MPLARDLLDDAVARLVAASVPSPRVDAELLLAHVTGRPRALLRMSAGNVTDEQAARYDEIVTARCTRRPLQHLTGRAPFRHLELAVGPGVFIPRPETELIVDAVLEHVRSVRSRATPPDAGGRDPRPVVDGSAHHLAGEAHGPLLVDLCSGSGALAIALATEVPGSRVFAVEVSDEAAGWLRRNVADHDAQVSGAGSVLVVHRADATRVALDDGVLADLRGRVDVVVTNPPYVPDDAIPREPEVRDHDPALALYGGPDGLDLIRQLAGQAALLLRPGGLLVIEHADVQGEQAGPLGVPGLLRGLADPAAAWASGRPAARAQAPAGAPAAEEGHGPPDGTPPAWVDVTDQRDLAGLPRLTTAVRSGGRGQSSDGGRGRMGP